MDTLKSKLYTLIAAQLGGEVLIFADQNSPRPPLPYWTMRIQSLRSLGDSYYGQGVTNEGVQSIYGTREATVAIARYGDESMTKCQGLIDNLSKKSVSELWAAQDINCYDTGDALNISQLLDKSIIEARAAVDLFVRFGSTLTDTVGAIETVEVGGDTDDDDVIDTVAVAPV